MAITCTAICPQESLLEEGEEEDVIHSTWGSWPSRRLFYDETLGLVWGAYERMAAVWSAYGQKQDLHRCGHHMGGVW